MTRKDDDLFTQQAYTNPEVVKGYIEAHSKNPGLYKRVEEFSQLIPGGVN